MEQDLSGSTAGRRSNSYEMRLESIGGLGAHLAGQILAEAGVLSQGLSGAHFSSYGSEKKGSPVKSYVRLAPAEHRIRITSPVHEPDLVAVFHEALLADPSVTAGLHAGATLIVNSARSAEEIAKQVKLPGVRVVALDAIEIAVQEKTRVNTAMLGAIVRYAPIVEAQAVRNAIAATFERKYPQLVAANLRTFDRGASSIGEFVLPAAPAKKAHSNKQAAAGPVVGYATAPIGGILPTPGSTFHKSTSTSRQGFLPVLHKEICVNCGVCDLVCPDFCLVWEKTDQEVNGYPTVKLLGIDYQYCKGCLACVQECPTGALTREREVGEVAAEHRVPLYGPRKVHRHTAVAEGR